MFNLTTMRLSMMMFLQFFLWGSWYVTAYLYLDKIGFGGSEIGWTYSVGPIAGMISPFFVGMIADRFFASERVLGLLHLIGGGVMYAAASSMQGEEPSALMINLLFFGHMLCYFPTLALTNSIALQNMTNSEKEFPLVRVFGTIGWIIAGLVVSLQEWDAAINMFYLASGTAIVMGLYSFTLPHTPPPAKGQKVSAKEVFGLDALVLLKRKSFMIFMASSMLVCIPLAFYYQMAAKFVNHTGQANEAAKMSFGQMSEIFFMLVMPIFFVRLGVKWMLALGMLAWVARYTLFALGADDGTTWMIIGGIVLHGICYDFFFVTGQIYTDKVAPPAIRSQAQGMLVLFTLGLGMFIGAQCAGAIEEAYTPDNWEQIADEAEEVQTEINELQTERDELYGLVDKPVYTKWLAVVFPPELSEEEAARDQEITTQMVQLREERSDILLAPGHWKMIWWIPAGGALLILIGFVLLFRDDVNNKEVTEGEVVDAASTTEQP